MRAANPPILPLALFSFGVSGAWIGDFTRLALLSDERLPQDVAAQRKIVRATSLKSSVRRVARGRRPGFGSI